MAIELATALSDLDVPTAADVAAESAARLSGDAALDGRLDTAEAKLASVAAGATANQTDAYLLARANHTGTQAIATIVGLVDALASKATPADISTAIQAVSGLAPASLDTLKEIADALLANGTSDAALVSVVAGKAPLASPTFTGTVSGVTKAHVGLGSVDNTADTAKPVSMAQQAALDLKANLLDTINAQTGTAYTLQASDNGKVVELSNAAAVTLTVPNSLPVGFNCILSQTGAGLVTVAAGAGATVNAFAGLKSPGQWGEMSLRVRANSGGSAALAILGGGVA